MTDVVANPDATPVADAIKKIDTALTAIERVTDTRSAAERVLAAIMGEVWVISDRGRDQLIEIASHQNVITKAIAEKIERRKEALATRRSVRMDGTKNVVKRGSVAMIEVIGPIVRYADIFSEISGATSIDTLARDFEAAMSDPSVKDIIIGPMDTPGGQVQGIHEFANQVYEARGKGKRIIAYVGAQASSGGYWIASACDEIVIDATAEVGSIGARVGMQKSKPAHLQTSVAVVSDRAPRKDINPETEAGQNELRATANAIEAVFVASVARNRGMTEEAVTAAQGAQIMGRAAVEAGLADRLGSLESIIAELGRPRAAAAPNNAVRKGARAMTTKSNDAAAEHETEAPAITAEAFAEMSERLTQMQGMLTKSEEDRVAAAAAQKLAEDKAKTTEANARVDAWERDGSITGNATPKVREVYVAVCTDQPVTPAQIEAMVAALPKLDTTRISESGAETKKKESEVPTREDWLAMEKDHSREANARIAKYVKSLATADKSKTYSQHLTAARMAAFAN